jgi:hypothetical protein
MTEYVRIGGLFISMDTEVHVSGRLKSIGPKFLLNSGPTEKRLNHRSAFRVYLCDCGNVSVIRCQAILNGSTQSCGCLAKDHLINRNITHGMTKRGHKSPEYFAWYNAKNRCTRPTDIRYPNYGGRGIKFCERWLNFSDFIADMGLRPGPDYSLDRIDNNGDYCPENCRWATVEQQYNNRTLNRIITVSGKSQTAAQWDREMGYPQGTVTRRIDSCGWSEEKAVTTPVRPCKKRK